MAEQDATTARAPCGTVLFYNILCLWRVWSRFDGTNILSSTVKWDLQFYQDLLTASSNSIQCLLRCRGSLEDSCQIKRTVQTTNVSKQYPSGNWEDLNSV